MKKGDTIRAIWPDGLEIVGEYKKEERGYIILTTTSGEIIVCNKYVVNFEIVYEKKESK